MTRIQTREGRDAPLPVRAIQRQVRRKMGRDVDPIGVYAHAPGMLIGYCVYEQATARQHTSMSG